MNYRIKPLKWKYKNVSKIYADIKKQWTAYIEFGIFRITKYKENDRLVIYYNTSDSDWGYFSSSGLAKAKKYCEKIYIKKLEKCLIKEKEK